MFLRTSKHFPSMRSADGLLKGIFQKCLGFFVKNLILIAKLSQNKVSYNN